MSLLGIFEFLSNAYGEFSQLPQNLGPLRGTGEGDESRHFGRGEFGQVFVSQ